MCECVCVCMGGQAAWRERRNTRQPPKLNLSGIQPVCGGEEVKQHCLGDAGVRGNIPSSTGHYLRWPTFLKLTDY